MKVVKKIIDISLYLILMLCMIIAAFYIVPQLMNYEVSAQNSSRMAPDIEPGYLVYAKKCDPAGVEIGDIALFDNGSSDVASKIVYIDYENNIIETKYNNSSETVYKSFSDLKGKYTAHFSNLGLVIEFLETPRGAAIAVSITVFLLAASIIIDALIKTRNMKKTTDDLVEMN